MKSRRITGPRLLLGLLLLVVAVAVVVAIRTPSVDVELASVRRAPLIVTLDDLGETRVRDLFVVSAPITGQLLRVPLKPGDLVLPGKTILARIQPVQADPLDPRSYAQALASVRAAGATLEAARTHIDEASAARTLAEREYDRASQLFRRGFVSRARVDEARAARDRSRAAVGVAAQTAAAAEADLAGARAALMRSSTGGRGARSVTLTSPVRGFVLSVPQESERVVAAGTPLVQIGDPERLEVVADLLTADAVRVLPGAEVFVDDWGGGRPLKGRVRLVEPFGFAKISALGVEEQRVNVVIDLAEPRDVWQRLGHGYRVTVRIVVASVPDAVQVPISALVRRGAGWSVFVLDNRRRAREVGVDLGPMNDRAAGVRSGLEVGQQVIVHPSDRIMDGVRVAPQD